uniref:Uncharacterized protein n=1 Tax=Ditylum brightwellii TaxID=49249 RepID=A0A7S4QCK8_9STRA|mmetsp:Transcript_19029/g.27663  ORF Transcript_19029/g.27663 Transcript_19029/m.27663 type:complete len:365 (+) Transcript_19029:129-1223(+)
MTDSKIFELLNFDPENFSDVEDEKLSADEILKEIELNPHSAEMAYPFLLGKRYPLHQAIALGAPLNVVKALSLPLAVKAKCEAETALHFALRYDASPDTVLYLLSKYPGSAREKGVFGNTPLHLACQANASIGVVSSLMDAHPAALSMKNTHCWEKPLHCACKGNASLDMVKLIANRWPEALQKKNIYRRTPLHLACRHHAPLDVVSFLAEAWPDAVRDVTNGYTLLHHACLDHAPLEVILLLLYKWPEATLRRNSHGETPLAISNRDDASTEVQSKVLSYVSQLCDNNIDENSMKEAMKLFIEIGWLDGIVLLLDRKPQVLQGMDDMDIKLLPDFFTMVKRRCKFKTMWYLLNNMQEILSDTQ